MADDNVKSLIDDPAIEAVEIKLTVLDSQEQLVHTALQHAKVEPEERVVYYFDTDNLDLYQKPDWSCALARSRATPTTAP